MQINSKKKEIYKEIAVNEGHSLREEGGREEN